MGVGGDSIMPFLVSGFLQGGEKKGGGRVFQVDAFMRQRTSLPLKSWSLLLHFSPSSIRKPPAGSSAYSGVSGRDVEPPPPPFVYVVISWQQESRLSRLSLPLFFFFFPSHISPQSTPA